MDKENVLSTSIKKKKNFLKTGAEEKRKVQRKTGEMRKKREGRDCVLLHRETTPPHTNAL